MRKELGLLNIICIIVVVGFLAMAVISVLGSGRTHGLADLGIVFSVPQRTTAKASTVE